MSRRSERAREHRHRVLVESLAAAGFPDHQELDEFARRLKKELSHRGHWVGPTPKPPKSYSPPSIPRSWM